MNTQKYQIRLTPEQTLTHLTTIASGLLAGGHLTDEIDVTASSVLLELMTRIEWEINEVGADRYIDEGDYERPVLPGSDRDRRKKWLDNPTFQK